MTISMKHRTLNVITIVFMAVVISLLLTACRSSKAVAGKTVIQTDTVYQTHDSIIIRERPVPVEVKIPDVRIERVAPRDTTSVIQTDLYKSTAWIQDGLLHHVLESKPNAVVTGVAQVTDTTKTTDSHQSVTNSQNIQRTDKIYINRLTRSQKFFCASGKIVWAVVGGAILFFVARFFLRKYGYLKK